MELSVVIPVHNEEANIQPLVDEIVAALSGRLDYEIVYVDDGSSDGTAAAVRHAAAAAPVRLLRHDTACGQSTAVYSGVHAARGALIATLDGDGQNDPADIPRLLDVVRAATDDAPVALAIGHRQKRNDTFIRRMSSRIANGVRSRLLRDETPDTGCGLKVFSRSVFLELPYFDHMHRFMPALVRRTGGCVVSVPVNHRPRERGKSKYGIHNRLWVGIVDLFGVAWLQRRERRPSRVSEEPFDGR
ncbi:MAG: glycosyltransferase family 2 protein [Gammaproteobacteria bacterium]|jgi:dolichol-phosphate mannosyltransferase